METEKIGKEEVTNEPSSKGFDNLNENKGIKNVKNQNPPGEIHNAAGMNNPNKFDNSGKIGAEPLATKSIDRGN